jgi:hypothetical protein
LCKNEHTKKLTPHKNPHLKPPFSKIQNPQLKQKPKMGVFRNAKTKQKTNIKIEQKIALILRVILDKHSYNFMHK